MLYVALSAEGSVMAFSFCLTRQTVFKINCEISLVYLCLQQKIFENRVNILTD